MFCMYSFLRLLLYVFRRCDGVFTPRAVVLCCLFSLSGPSLANDFTDKITVFEEDGVYYINASSEISASAQHVHHVITDYIHIYRLSDSIIESRVITIEDSNKIHVETLVQCCVPMFCKDVMRVEEVSELGPGHIQTKIIPEKSDFRSGTATWKIESKGDITHLTYKATLEPDFFIPPLIGTKVVIDNMRDEFSTTFFRIERIAMINEAREWNNDFQFVQQPPQQNIELCTSATDDDPQC